MNEQVLQEARQLISGFLLNRRKELGITQDELAELSGMGVATIRRFESGKFWLNLKQYLILCHYLKYPSFDANLLFTAIPSPDFLDSVDGVEHSKPLE